MLLTSFPPYGRTFYLSTKICTEFTLNAESLYQNAIAGNKKILKVSYSANQQILRKQKKIYFTAKISYNSYSSYNDLQTPF